MFPDLGAQAPDGGGPDMRPPAANGVLVVDDAPLSRRGLSDLARSGGFNVVGTAEQAGPAAAMAWRRRPNVVLVNLESDVSALDAVRVIVVSAPGSRIVVLLDDEDLDVRGALAAGARGCLRKGAPTSEILAALRAVGKGELVVAPPAMRKLIRQMRHESGDASGVGALTPREVEVLELLARGWNNTQIAAALYVSHSTVKHHISSILKKLGVSNRLQAALRAADEGLVDR